MKIRLLVLFTSLLCFICFTTPFGAAQSQQPAAKSPADAALAEAAASFEKRENDKALAAYERGAQLDPRSPDAHLGRCRTLARLFRHAEAIPACTRALELRPKDAMILRYRGHFNISLRRFDDAVADLMRAEQLKKDSFDIYYHLALAHYLRGDFDKAAAAYDGCMANAKEDDDVIACSAWQYAALVRAGHKKEAIYVLQRITPGTQAKENGAYLDRLLLFKGEKTEQQVVEAMERDKEKDGGLAIPTVAYGVGLWHLLHGRNAEARRYFERATNSEYKTAFGYIAAETELKRMK